MADPLDGLSPVERGFVLALALAGGELGALAAVAPGGPGAAACRAALAALEALPRAERVRLIARLMRAAGDPVPPGIERVHPGWLRAALEGEATEVLLAVRDGLPAAVAQVAREILAARGDDSAALDLPLAKSADADADADADDTGAADANLHADGVRELCRAAFSSLAAMPDRGGGELASGGSSSSWRRLAALPAAALLDEIARAGATALGASLAGAPPAVIARAAVRSGGGAVADAVLEAARQAPSDEDRARSRAQVAAAAQLAVAGELGPAHAVGFVVLAHRLAPESPEAVRAIAQRLPPALGQILIDEHARTDPPPHPSAAQEDQGAA